MTLAGCELQEWGKQSRTSLKLNYAFWSNQGTAVLNSNRCFFAPLIVFLLSCFGFLYFNCLWAAQSINVILHSPPAFSFKPHQGRHPPLRPKGSEEIHVTRWSHRSDNFTSHTQRTQWARSHLSTGYIRNKPEELQKVILPHLKPIYKWVLICCVAAKAFL